MPGGLECLFRGHGENLEIDEKRCSPCGKDRVIRGTAIQITWADRERPFLFRPDRV